MELTAVLIDYISDKQMQIPGSLPYSLEPSMFEAILEECSNKHIEIDEQEQQHDLHHPMELQAKREQRSNSWFWLHQTPFESIPEDNDNTLEDLNLEFKRVKSLREQQQTKIAQFLRSDKCKSNRCIDSPTKNDSPVGKYSQSLSPKKTKRIEKGRGMKLVSTEEFS